MPIYTRCGIYITSRATTEAKIAAIDNIIAQLMTMSLNTAMLGNEQEISFDDGQSKEKVVYRSVESIIASIQGYERIKTMYINDLNGHAFTLVDAKNFIGPLY